MGWLAENYLWLKAFHVISVVAWMAGLLYLPRLYVYHAEAAPGSAQSETFKIMERRLLRGIMNPAMLAVYLFGALMLLVPGSVDWSTGWIWVKLALVAAMTVLHHRFARWRRIFEADGNTRPARYYKIANEVPTVLMIAIVVLVIVKPF